MHVMPAAFPLKCWSLSDNDHDGLEHVKSALSFLMDGDAYTKNITALTEGTVVLILLTTTLYGGHSWHDGGTR
jgi:hypothetical protein